MEPRLESAASTRPEATGALIALEPAPTKPVHSGVARRGRQPPPLPSILSDGSGTSAAPDEGTFALELRYSLPSWLASLVVHLTLIVALALAAREGLRRAGVDSGDIAATIGRSSDGAIDAAELDNGLATAGAPAAIDAPLAPLLPSGDEPTLGSAPKSGAVDESFSGVRLPLPPERWTAQEAASSGPRSPASGGAAGGESLSASGPGGAGDLERLANAANARLGDGLAARVSGAYRAEMVRRQGGTPESERAVRLALKWLVEHQLPDGSWSFEHTQCRQCRQRCGNNGSLRQCRIASTALALLPFLGAGQTHQDGEYRRNVDRGLYFLQRQMSPVDDGASLWDEEGRMYGHGLASIVLCEAYGMTRDRGLREPAQQAINFIVAAQDPNGGGWRYRPRQMGDTSVVGWQLMALRSAELAYLKVPAAVWRRADYFLDFVQSDGGAQYGYVTTGRGPATNAIGLLGRMFIGWDVDRPALVRGVELMAAAGPSTPGSQTYGGMYFNYYATQTIHHVGGPSWERWNESMRDFLVGSQATRGHERGSWYVNAADHGAYSGGRLYCTALAAMTLEIYYRYLPIYGQDSLQPPQLQ